MKMNDDGSFNLYVGATDIGTGSDTILSQIAAETLKVPVEMILILSSDTDLTPFDTGAYASSPTVMSRARRCFAAQGRSGTRSCPRPQSSWALPLNRSFSATAGSW